jgi:PAS domain S-box-containing protein
MEVNINSIKIVSKLRKKYGLALSILAIMIILSQVIIQSTLYIEEYDSHIVNISGRQRMLSQRINKAAFGLYVSTNKQDKVRYLNELKTSIELWDESYNGLQNGDKNLDLPGTNNPKIISLFKVIEPQYEVILNAATNITMIASNDSYNSENLLPDIQTIKNNESEFLSGMDDIVSEYDIEFKLKILKIRIIEMFIMMSSFLILSLEILYIFKPALKNVKSAMEGVENNKEMLREEKELLGMTLFSISEGIITTDSYGKIILMNKSAEKFTGWSSEDAYGEDFYKIFNNINSKTRERNVELVKYVIQTGKSISLHDYELLISKDGSEIYIYGSANRIVSNDGQVKGVIVSFTDVTKQYEQEKEIEGYLNVNIDMFSVVDTDGNFIKVNKTFENVLGYNIDELKGKNILSMIHQDDIISTFKMIKQLEERKSVMGFLVRYRCTDGSYRNLELGAELNGKYIYVSARDITEKLKMEAELLKNTQSELIARIVENLDVLFIRYTYPEFNFIDMNYTAYNFLRKINPKIGPLSSIIGYNISQFFNYNEKDEIINGIKNSIRQKVKSYFRYRKLIVGGEEKILKCIYQPLFELNDQITEIIVIAIDVTEEIKAKNEMEETLKVQDEVFANMAHELKTPLNVIFSSNQLMELHLKNNSLEDSREKISQGINIIKQNCHRFTKLINNIVDISKMDSGFFKLKLSNQNIVEVVEEIVQSISSYINGKGINVVFDTNIEEKIIACDPEKIERIILNLISNAIKFTNLDGMIFVNLTDKGDTVEISVKDTGIGMDTKYLSNIFKRFHQVDKSLSRNSEGSGIGLSLVKSLIELHGGKISVESNLGEGSIFKIELPSRTIDEDEAAIDKINLMDSKIEMINIEFSDIYSI